MPQIFVLPRQVALDDDASPMSGALLYFFSTNSTTPQAVYSDIALTTPHAHPIIADSAGEFPKIYLDADATVNYRVRLTTASGVLLYQEDDIDRFTVSQAEIGRSIYPRTQAEISAGIVPVAFEYEAYNAKRYGALGDGSANDTDALQDWLDCCGYQTGYLPAGTYKIVSQLNAPDRCVIRGDGRDTSILTYAGTSPITGGAMLKFATRSAFRVQGIGFRCTNAGSSNTTIQLHLENCVYFEVSDISFGASGSGPGVNNIRGCLCDQTSAGFVPPRGDGCFRNILYVVEPTNSGASGSRAIHVKGHASQAMNHVIFDGEGNLEHAYYEIHLENANNCYIGAWQLRGSTQNEIRMDNCANCMIVGAQMIPPPAADVPTSAGLYIDSNCVDNVVINPAFNFTSGVPSIAISDNGGRTSIIHPGAPGFGLTVQGKLNGSYQFRKADGVGHNLEVIRTTTDTDAGVVIRSDVAQIADAFLVINRGTGPAGEDIFRLEGGASLFERVASDGYHYFHSPVFLGAGTPQTRTDSGAVNTTTTTTLVVTTGAAALTLADGAEGQTKFIVMKTDGGDATLTPTNLYNGTTITFNDVGDSAHLQFIDGQWVFMGGTATLA